MAFIVDIVFLLIIAICFIVGMKRGFFKSVIDMFSTLIAMVITVFTYRFAADFINKKFVLPKVTETVRNMISSNGTVTDISKLFTEKKNFFTAIITRFSDLDSVEKYYDTVKNSKDPIGSVSKFMAAPLADAISRVIAFIIVFIIAIVLIKLLAMFIGMLMRLPVLKQADGLLGAALGLAIGVFITWMFALVLANSLDSIMAVYPRWFPEGKTPEEIINSTLILRLFSGFKPEMIIDLLQK